MTHAPHPAAIARGISEKVDHVEVAGVDVNLRWHLRTYGAIAHSEGDPVAHYRITIEPWDDIHGCHGYVADQATPGRHRHHRHPGGRAVAASRPG